MNHVNGHTFHVSILNKKFRPILWSKHNKVCGPNSI